MTKNNRSEEGYERQRQHVARILKAGEGMASVRHKDSKGRAVTNADDVRKGPDGGIDLVTEFEAKNKQALSRVQNIFNKKWKG
jgi:hypothetical protein